MSSPLIGCVEGYLTLQLIEPKLCSNEVFFFSMVQFLIRIRNKRLCPYGRPWAVGRGMRWPTISKASGVISAICRDEMLKNRVFRCKGYLTYRGKIHIIQ